MATEQTKVLNKKKETKRTVVYETESADAAISGVYVNKHFLGDVAPDQIEITVKTK